LMGTGGAETVQLFSPAAEDPAVHVLAGQQIQRSCSRSMLAFMR
jgi:hypothetical protein